ncbi:hypothetical protein P9486_27255, partial [Escherichia coli]|uniref:hypothetical protein n=1 Tax=Escherichia coli TaxID=562 RepID=UPI00398A5AB5
AGAVAPALALPDGLSTDADGPLGAVLGYVARATAMTGADVPVDCQPASDTRFPLGRTDVLCTAFDPAAGAVALGTFSVTVNDGPPV